MDPHDIIVKHKIQFTWCLVRLQTLSTHAKGIMNELGTLNLMEGLKSTRVWFFYGHAI